MSHLPGFAAGETTGGETTGGETTGGETTGGETTGGETTGGETTGGETTGGETTGGETGGLAGRARGALYGLAIGDALGMPTQLMPRPEIVRRWGPMLAGFEPAPPGHPIAAGQPAGAVTDDTEQAVLLGRLLVAGGGTVKAQALAGALVAWETDMAARGSADLLGPSTRRAVAAVPGRHPARGGRRRR